MSRFARVGENAVVRNSEVVGEELRLFVIIVFHSWLPPHICEFTLKELCEKYALNYDHSCARFKELRRKQWCEKVGKYPRPLVGMPNEKTSNIEVNDEGKTSNIEVNGRKKLQKLKLKTSNIEVNDDEKLQYLKLNQAHIRNIDLKKDLLEQPTTKIVVDTTTETNSHKSQYSKEDILRYIDVRIRKGEQIETPHKLAQWMYQTGDYDAFITATLYPEPIEQTIVYDDGESPSGDVPMPLDEYERLDARDLLKSLAENGADISEFKNNYTPEDWSWLKAQVK